MTFESPAPVHYWWPSGRTIWLLTIVTCVGLYAAQWAVWPFKSYVLLIGTPVLAFAPAGVLVRAARRRSAPKWAAAHGFRYQRKPDWPIPDWDIKPFNVGRAFEKKIADGMTGKVGDFPATHFHYQWINNNKLNESRHYRNVFTLELPKRLPRLTIGIAMDWEVGDRVEVESIDFNERFSVYSPEPRYAHAIVNPRVMERLMAIPAELSPTAMTKFAIVDQHLIALTIAGSRPEQMTGIFQTLRVIAEGIPRLVWDDYGKPV